MSIFIIHLFQIYFIQKQQLSIDIKGCMYIFIDFKKKLYFLHYNGKIQLIVDILRTSHMIL
ncbi:hypothetical protein MPAN_007450 [Mariniplasma anaerobium]|uniref:Uncharacterized protein n=1 Tax=Mariniplasma anaerobium TaxID=2735436 RepID=A0A7U9TGR9_9MOLU|nr:hypothetical protein MPAN_007450 [Mariniplasma anaerobium]